MTGLYKPWLEALSEAEGSMPIEPVSMAASSDRIIPNRLPVTTTSNSLGARTNCIAALSIYICDSSTSGYSRATEIMMSRQKLGGFQHIRLIDAAQAPLALVAAWKARGRCAALRFRRKCMVS